LTSAPEISTLQKTVAEFLVESVKGRAFYEPANSRNK